MKNKKPALKHGLHRGFVCGFCFDESGVTSSLAGLFWRITPNWLIDNVRLSELVALT